MECNKITITVSEYTDESDIKYLKRHGFKLRYITLNRPEIAKKDLEALPY